MRLVDFLSPKSLAAAERAEATIVQAIYSLREHPNRGRERGEGRRELIVPFANGDYIIRYRVAQSRVIILQMVHSKEAR